LRDSFDLTIADSAKNNVKPISKLAIESILWRHIHKNGIRAKPQAASPTNKNKYARTETYIAHSLRKFFNTTLNMHGINDGIKEMLMGHSQGIKLDNNYFRPTEDKILEAYKSVTGDLTISEENKLRL
jgi:hypothetical protein